MWKSSLFSIFSTNRNCVKPYKLQRINNNTRYGFTANSLENLRRKTAKHFKISENFKIVLEEDATEIDEEEYFSLLAPQTVFVVLLEGETWDPDTMYSAHKLQSDLNKLLLLGKNDVKIVSDFQQLMQTESNPAVLEIMSKILSATEMNIAASDRSDDPNWFEDVDNRFKTKEDFMTDRAKQRIRGYLYTAKDHIKDCKGSTLAMLKMLLEEFENQLKKKQYFGHYFCRNATEKTRLCNDEGWFKCGGSYDVSCCLHQHLINPYGSAASRLIFSTWNLDHRIEKSREVLPRLVEAVEGLSRVNRKLNHGYFFDMLFTMKNLKLVHIVCHDKKEHSEAKCDPNQFYV